MLKIETMPYKPFPENEQCDWFAWLKTEDKIYIHVQIGAQATEKCANEIIHQMCGGR